MKKFAKGCLIAALSMLTIGVIILAVCTFIGGTKIYAYAQDEIKNNPYVEDFFVDVDDFFGGDIVSWHHGEMHMSFDHNYPTHSGDDQDFQAALASDVSNLNLEIGAGSCIISESDDAYFHIYSKNAGKYQYYTENGTFHVRGFDHNGKGVHVGEYNEIYLEIPKNVLFESIEIELGAGKIEADSLLASGRINMEIGAGELEVNTLNANWFNVDLGVGDMEVKNGSVNDSEVNIGMGEMTYSGRITGDFTAECGFGDLDLYLDDSVNDHNYELDCSVGDITLNQTNYSGISYTEKINNNADSTYAIECAGGKITIDFKK